MNEFLANLVASIDRTQVEFALTALATLAVREVVGFLGRTVYGLATKKVKPLELSAVGINIINLLDEHGSDWVWVGDYIKLDTVSVDTDDYSVRVGGTLLDELTKDDKKEITRLGKLVTALLKKAAERRVQEARAASSAALNHHLTEVCKVRRSKGRPVNQNCPQRIS